jgi:hypothetical protein
MNLSKLKIMQPHNNPKRMARHAESKIVYNAYPADIAASKPVKNTVAPMPVYLLASAGQRFKMLRHIPEQNQKKFLIDTICILLRLTKKKDD